VIIPLILLLIYLGTFAEKNAFPDLILMLFFGVLGWVMQRLDWPRPPFILGLVLGNLAESRLFLSVNNYGLAWLARPAVIIIMLLTLAAIFYSLVRRKRQKMHGTARGASLGEAAISTEMSAGLRFNWAAVFSLCLIVAFAAALWQSRTFSFTAGFFPWVLGFPILALAIVQFILDLMGRKSRSDDEHLAEAMTNLPQDVVNRRTAGVFGWAFGWLAAIWLFGFTIGATLCTFIQLKIGEREKWPLALILTAAAWAFIYGVFDRLLHVPFPKGQVFLWLKQLGL